MVRRLEQNMGAAALLAATGRDHAGWRQLLTEAGALDWSHAATAKHLVEVHGLDGWWAQGVTVDFEQACKGRVPGQRADGTFAVARTATVPGSRLEALAAVTDAITSELGEPHGQNLTASMPIVRWRPADGTRVSAAAQPENKSGTPITLTWEKLPDADAMATARAASDALFEQARRDTAREPG